MKLPAKEDWFTIPNLMGYFRILLIPVFIWAFLRAETPRDYFLAACVLGLSGLTDLFDGKIARKFNQVTELGKFLDPLADKLTQGVLVICLATRRPTIWILAALVVFKECFMAVMGILLLRRNGRKLDGAMWFGKVCTAVLYVALVLLLLLPAAGTLATNVIVGVCAVVVVLTLWLYVPVFHGLWKKEPLHK